MQESSFDPGVLAVLGAYRAAVHAGDADRYAALFHQDAVQCPPGRPPVVGQTAIRDFLVRSFAARTEPSTFEITPEHVDLLGDIATVVTHPTSGGTNPTDLTALFVLRRVDDQWLIWRQAVTRRS